MTGARELVREQLLGTSRRLLSLGPRTLGQDVALLRSPIWHLVSQSLRDRDLIEPSGPLVQVEGPALTVVDQRIFAELFTRWARRGFPEDHTVRFFLAELVAAIGIQKGGSQMNTVRAALRRLASAVLAEVRSDGDGQRETGAALVAHYDASTRPRTPWAAQLNPASAAMLLRHPITYLDGPTWDAILREDALAARLWVWLEGERIPQEWRWTIFPSSRESLAPDLLLRNHEQRSSRRTAPIARLLAIDTWKRRRNIVERIRQAVAVVSAVDSRYELAVEGSISDAGNYVLRCSRRDCRPGTAPDRPTPTNDSGPIPAAVDDAWHAAVPTRRLSSRQQEIVRALVAEWGATRVITTLTTAEHDTDPFHALLVQAQGWQEERETAWAKEKAEETASGRALLESLRARGLPAPPTAVQGQERSIREILQG